MQPKTDAMPHMGRKIQRIRTIKGIQQKTFARQLGIQQSTLSNIENSEEVSEDRLKQIADALEMSVEAIKNFNEDAVVNYIQNNYDSASASQGGNHNSPNDNSSGNYHFNPIRELIEVLEVYKKATEESKALYVKLLESELAKNKMLEEMMRKSRGE
jgi:transcriptional regulator with XRE-family HTH domain